MPRPTRATRLILGLLLLALPVVVGVPAGAGHALAQDSPTPTPRVLQRPAATATPPPAVHRATAAPAPSAAAPAPAGAPTPAPAPPPTVASSPTPLPAPPPTSAPPPPAAAPTIAPAAPIPAPPAPTAQPLRISFAAADWTGGLYRGDARFYGRPWTAVYGAESPYPRAALAFSLDATPTDPATLTVAGLDDEWAAPNTIALEVNGERLFDGPSPFANWDGVGVGADAAWTDVAFPIPAGLLRAGRNEIVVANLTPSANVGIPPYVLLAEATLEIAGGAGAPPTPAAVAAADWSGGYYQGNARFYGRPWVAVYGAASAYPRATLAFRLGAVPRGPATLEVDGLDDELPGPNPIAVEVNGRTIYTGPSPFADWDGRGNGADADWTRVAFTLPAASLRAGRNEVTIANLSASAAIGAPPYVLLAEGSLAAPEANVTILPGAKGRGGDR